MASRRGATMPAPPRNIRGDQNAPFRFAVCRNTPRGRSNVNPRACTYKSTLAERFKASYCAREPRGRVLSWIHENASNRPGSLRFPAVGLGKMADPSNVYESQCARVGVSVSRFLEPRGAIKRLRNALEIRSAIAKSSCSLACLLAMSSR